ncbi:MAG: phytoene/squalene synthase family protein [Ignavibacteria bacterium]|nr:phytoene/squalene synthase family protein [Ignavibacteria bacterium]
MGRSIEENITRRSGTSFYYTFMFLPKHQKKAMHTVYAFCRLTDDIADSEDETNEEKLQKLEEWKEELSNALTHKSKYEILNHLAEVIRNLKMSVEPFFDLIEGMKMDLTKKRYETFEELKLYCYRVASTIGLMSIELFGYKNPASRDYAYNLGIAMQLTNILRDVKEDMKRNRIYIPKEDLDRYNYSEYDLLNQVQNNSFKELMRFEAERAEYFYNEANKFFLPEEYKVLAMGRAMQEIYCKILKKIKENNFDVFNKNNNLSKVERLFLTLKNYFKYSFIMR